jgi:competence protein ComEA
VNVQPIVLKLDAGKKKGEDLAAPINVNRATAAELQRLPGVGPTLSGRIIQVRDRQPFRSVEELRRVPGIGPKTLEHLRPFVTVGG